MSKCPRDSFVDEPIAMRANLGVPHTNLHCSSSPSTKAPFGHVLSASPRVLSINLAPEEGTRQWHDVLYFDSPLPAPPSRKHCLNRFLHGPRPRTHARSSLVLHCVA